jgi:hypothetical protein
MGKQKLEIVQMESIECSYKNEFFNIDWKKFEKTLSLGKNITKTKFLNFPENQTILVDCEQDYVQCIKAEATIPYFEYSSEDHIKVEINFGVITKQIGKMKSC